jgi:hypothetical protein
MSEMSPNRSARWKMVGFNKTQAHSVRKKKKERDFSPKYNADA